MLFNDDRISCSDAATITRNQLQALATIIHNATRRHKDKPHIKAEITLEDSYVTHKLRVNKEKVKFQLLHQIMKLTNYVKSTKYTIEFSLRNDLNLRDLTHKLPLKPQVDIETEIGLSYGTRFTTIKITTQ